MKQQLKQCRFITSFPVWFAEKIWHLSLQPFTAQIFQSLSGSVILKFFTFTLKRRSILAFRFTERIENISLVFTLVLTLQPTHCIHVLLYQLEMRSFLFLYKLGLHLWPRSSLRLIFYNLREWEFYRSFEGKGKQKKKNKNKNNAKLL